MFHSTDCRVEGGPLATAAGGASSDFRTACGDAVLQGRAGAEVVTADDQRDEGVILARLAGQGVHLRRLASVA
jgi:hypothetical protein